MFLQVEPLNKHVATKNGNLVVLKDSDRSFSVGALLWGMRSRSEYCCTAVYSTPTTHPEGVEESCVDFKLDPKTQDGDF